MNTIENKIQSAPKLDKLDDKSKLKLERAVRDFESLFVNYLLKSMQSTIPKSEEDGGGFGNDVMEGMFNLEVSRQISRTSSMGIGDVLYKQLTGEELPKPEIRRLASEGMEQLTHRKTQTLSPGDAASFLLPADQKISPNSAMDERMKKISGIILSAAEKHGIPPNLIKAVIATESAANPRAVSGKNAKGLMQMIDSTAAEMGVNDVWNPGENVAGGTRYLRMMLDRYNGNTKLALASYNAGPGAVDRFSGIPPYKETQNYVAQVMKYLNYFDEMEQAENE